MSNDSSDHAVELQVELKNFFEVVRQRHERVNPCFMTGKGCVYTDQIDQELKDREKQGTYRGFMIMPFRPRLGVFFKNCLRPFFYSNYGKGIQSNIAGQPTNTTPKLTLECADDVSRPGIIICEGICKRIQESDFVVADISVPNDNVFYELGLAYGIGQKLILVHQMNAMFGSTWAKYLRSDESERTEYKVKEYNNLQMIKREEFNASRYVWKRKGNTGNELKGDPEILFFEMMMTGEKEPDPAPTGMEDNDICLSFRTHVMSDIGLALDRIASSLKEQDKKQQSVIPSEYLDNIIRPYLDKAQIVEPQDPFEKTRKRIEDCYCLFVRTGMDCHPMSYFWLGYGHACGKNTVPITQLIKQRQKKHGTDEDDKDGIRTTDVPSHSYESDKGEIFDLAFDIRAQRHMVFDPLRPELLEHQLEQTLSGMIRADFSEWSRKRFWKTLLGSRGDVSIITGALHSEDHNREMIGDWDLRAASELASYFSRNQYSPKIETPIYQPEFAMKFDKEMNATSYIDQVTKDISIGDKNCVIIASPDVNPLTEILLGRLNGVRKDELFSSNFEAEDYPEAIIVYKQRKKLVSGDSTPNKQKIPGGAPRAFYQEVAGESGIEKRGFRSRLFAENETKLSPYYGQNEYRQQGDHPFDIYAHLIVARNPFTAKGKPTRYVIILNGVSGPATCALAHVITGGGNEEFESYKQSKFDPAATSESILNKVLGCMRDRNFNCIECVINVKIGEEPPTVDSGDQPTESRKHTPGGGATFDWRRILSWSLNSSVLGREIRER